jgi:chorismate lyase/3-hydroxybenzoate synthase
MTLSDPNQPAFALHPQARLAEIDAHCLAQVLAGRANSKFPDAFVLPLRDLVGSSRIEFWRVPQPPAREAHAHFCLQHGDGLLFGELRIDEDGDLAQATEHAYGLMQAHSHRLGFPHLLRVWHYFGAINAGEDDAERYRQFCVGRARVISARPDEGYAAATAIGVPAPPDQLVVQWIAAKQPGIAIENPRQVPAFDYPRDYGPVSPGFSRAMLLPGPVPLLLVSGTASIVGHASQHDDTRTQLDEIFINIESLLHAAEVAAGARADLANDGLLRVYLRDPSEASAVRGLLLERLGSNACFMLLHGDVCRENLRVEVEAAVPMRRALA